MHTNHNATVTALEVVFFTLSGWVVAFDWKSLDSVLIGPLQHLVGIISGSVAIIVGLPVAIAHLQKLIAFIKQKIQN